MNEVPPLPGTYSLMIFASRAVRVRVGSLGSFSFPRGVYLYVGSARGKGGLKARVQRHLTRPKVKRWHIDYLMGCDAFRAVAVSFGISAARRERVIAQELVASGMRPYINGFGSSDDPKTPSHLLRCDDPTEVCRAVLLRVFSRLFKNRSSHVLVGSSSH